MEYGIRTRGLSGSGGGGGGPSSWLESAATYGHPLAAFQFPSSTAFLLNSLQSLQQSGANATELLWKSDKHTRPPDEDDEEADEDEDEDEQQRSSDNRVTTEKDGARGDEEEEEEEERPDDEVENEASAESWKDTAMPVLSGWMLNAYASMLGRLSAATAALEAAGGSNLTSDSESESNHSSYTDVLSRESSPSSSLRQTYEICERGATTKSASRSKKRRTSDCKARSRKNGKEASSSDAATSETSQNAGQGKNKRSLALQRVRYEREEYRCSLCSYACTIEKAFQRHLRAHARGTATETRVSCAVCGADRSSEVDLSKHMRRHRDNRYFCCDICIFRTVQLKKLIQHRRMHTGEKPHLCPHCSYRSARRDNLRSHVRRVHKKENLYCDTFSPRGMFIAPTKLQPPASPDDDQPSPSPSPPPIQEQQTSSETQQQSSADLA